MKNGTSRNYTFTWEQERLLKSLTRSGTNSINNQYTYDESNDLTKITKTNGTTIEYFYSDGLLEYEVHRNSSGTLTKVHKYFYDADGEVQFLLVKTDNFFNANKYNLYHYVRDAIGNIVHLVQLRQQSTSGTNTVNILAATYSYSAYGEVSVTNHSGTIGTTNPIRYKGYYYDEELGWYHLQTRYYDPVIGRFISPDDISVLDESQTDITDKNLYSYCDNNPIMRKDQDGEFWHIAIGAVIGAGVELASQVMSGKKLSQVSWGSVAAAGAVGGVTAAVGPAMGALVSGTATGISEGIKTKSFTEGLKAGVVGAGLSLLGAGGAKLAVYKPKACFNMLKVTLKDLKAKKITPLKKVYKDFLQKNLRFKTRKRYKKNSLFTSILSGFNQYIYNIKRK